MLIRIPLKMEARLPAAGDDFGFFLFLLWTDARGGARCSARLNSRERGETRELGRTPCLSFDFSVPQRKLPGSQIIESQCVAGSEVNDTCKEQQKAKAGDISELTSQTAVRI